MKKIFKIVLSYLLITFNTFVFAIENKDENILKIGVLLPLTGELKSLGEDMLYAINLALHDIDNPKIKIYPKDSGSKKEKIIQACKEFRNEDIKIIIGPTDSEFFKDGSDYWMVADNIKGIYMSDGSMRVLLDFERVMNELDIFAFRNWELGELVAGPEQGPYKTSCTFLWPANLMPDPRGAMRLLPFDCEVKWKNSVGL